jgi:hypothetical protein
MSKKARIDNKKKRDEQKAERRRKNSLAYNRPGPKRQTGESVKVKRKSNGPQNQFGKRKVGSNKGIALSIKKQKRAQAEQRQVERLKRSAEEQIKLICSRLNKVLDDIMNLKEVKRLLKK